MHSFEKLFALTGQELASRIEFVCSDMWRPHLEVIARHCPRALNILDRFHMVAKLNNALDEVRADEARRMLREGYRTFRIADLSLYHGLGRLPEPKLAHSFF